MPIDIGDNRVQHSVHRTSPTLLLPSRALTCFFVRLLRSLNKQIKDKNDQINGLKRDLDSDAEEKVELERRIEVSVVGLAES